MKYEDAISHCGLEHAKIPPHFIADNKWHRFDVKRPGDKAGAYIAKVVDGKKIVTIKNFKIGAKATFVEQLNDDFFTNVPPEDNSDVREMVRQITERQMFDLLKQSTEVIEHPYLSAKKIKPNNLFRLFQNDLIVPLFDFDGKNLKIKSIQTIKTDGTKRFFPGLSVSGLFFFYGDILNATEIFVCEGVATGATIFEQTQTPTVCAMFADNLKIVVAKFATKKITIIADNDESKKGEETAKQTGLPYVLIPTVGMDANDYVNAGGNLKDLIKSEIKKNTRFVPGPRMKNLPSLRWLIKNFLPAESLAMVHGQAGSGKSFWVLDLALRVATNADYHGIPIRNTDKRSVAYLNGEGLYGLNYRYQAWSKYYNNEVENIFFSSITFNFSDTTNFQQLKKDLAEINPCLIIVDTLHRHWDGDENSSQDAKQMIDACDELKRDFKATVLIVHHTGVSSEAQGRARGSSAWRGALDAEFSLTIDNDQRVVTVEQKKNKDGELYKPISFWLENVDLEQKNEDGDEIISCVLVKKDETHEEKKDKDDGFKVVDNLELQNALTSLVKENKAKVETEKITIAKKDLIDYLLKKEIEKIKRENEILGLDLDEEKIKRKAYNLVGNKLRPESNRWFGRLLKRGTLKQDNDQLYTEDQKIINLVKIVSS